MVFNEIVDDITRTQPIIKFFFFYCLKFTKKGEKYKKKKFKRENL